MITLKGIAASPGIAIGKAFVYKKEEIVQAQRITDVKRQLERLKRALETSKKQLEEVKEKAAKEIGKAEADIFEAHLAILEDPSFIEDVMKNIEERGLNAEVAVQEAVKKYVAVFETMKDEYFRARTVDVQDVGSRILNNLRGVTYDSLSKLKSKVIVIAKVLTPSDTAQMKKEMVLGLATDTGGITSHTAIIARSLGIPAVVGIGNITQDINNGDDIIVDGITGTVIINPSKDIVTQFEKKKINHAHREETKKKP